ncbi:hypothetical protein FB382_003185 [Nocardioides ginsengisegetis]|uniref:Uncharacterized protein n=1 Tax=Nocardioides ginsengisegetis TaxID=661491 RepID=A0A7W3J2D5_9ACTN|nr:hypothetical protein [Nocardioides ginsengisegetis]MBA8804894.1 hypothetical protein [Nocardioides ginsengisegetis]
MNRFFVPLAAAALAGAMLPVATGGSAHAEDGGDAPAFSGFSTTSWSAPVRLEIYEPTIPLPATPQMELNFGYSRVEADSTSSNGRASWMWPGDSIGEGAKVIVEMLGLPPELSGPLAAQGYPVQVNSTFPSGENTQSDQPFPGTVMTTTASQDRTTASTGYSTNCDVSDGDTGGSGGSGGDGGGDSPIPGIPGLPELPGIPGLPGLGTSGGNVHEQMGLAALGKTSTGKTTTTPSRHRSGKRTGVTTAAEDGGGEAAECQFPPQLAALIDLGGYISSSRSVSSADEVVATSRAALGDVSIAGGVIRMSGINARAVSSSNGTKTNGEGAAAYGTMTIAGQEFGMGPEGFTAAGSPAPIPGLPDDPTKALEALGVHITMPKPVYTRDADKITTTVEGLVVDIDTSILRHKLDALPWNVFTDIVNQIPFPPEAGPLKSALLSAVTLAPRFVLHLGTATATVQTVQGIDIPPVVPDNDPGGDDEGGTGGGTDTSSSGGSVPPGSTTPTTGGDTTPTDTGDSTTEATEPVAAGLPTLFSIPGLLLFGGIAVASVAGSYFRKLGAAALGGGATCPHGLDSGLPDLRKA